VDVVEKIAVMMAELGPALDADEVRQHGDDNWVLVLDGASLVVTYRSDIQSIMLCHPVGCPSVEQRLAAYEAMLLYNSLWREHGGIRLALQEPGGEVEQLFELPVADLDLDTLKTVAENLLSVGSRWQQFFDAAISQSANLESLSIPHLNEGIIRG